MEYIEPPPTPKRDEKKLREKTQKGGARKKDEGHIFIQKAQVRDVEEILDLVNSFAASNLMLPRGPQYLYENIRDFVIACDRNIPIYSLTETREILYMIVACGSLHVLWEDIAEIRALAIHQHYQHLGLGSELVQFMKEEAKKLGIRRLITFTLTGEFFKTLGFKQKKRDELPPKVWSECSRCPKYFRCDEVGMVLDL